MNIIRRCQKCGEIVYRFKKGERPSDTVLGAECWLHLILCDLDEYDRRIEEAFQ